MAPSSRTRGVRPAGRARARVYAVLSAAAIVAGLLTAWTTPGVAAEGPVQPPPPGSNQHQQSWALSPTGTDPNDPSSRPTLSYELAPGATIKDSVSVWNFGDVTLTFHVYATDAFNNQTGQFTLFPGATAPRDVGGWVKLQTNDIAVAPKQRVDIPITVTVPADAAPGDHAGAVLASSPTPTLNSQGQPITVDRRVGSRIYLRVTGPVNPELVVENLSTKYHGIFNPFSGSADVEYTVRNPGNVRLGAHQTLVVKDPLGRTVATRALEDIAELLPDNAVTIRTRLTGIEAAVRLTTEVKLEPFRPQGVSERMPEALSVTGHAWAIPWTLLLLAALAFLLWRISKRWRDRQQGPAPRTFGGAGRGGPRPIGPAGGGRRLELPSGRSRPRQPERVGRVAQSQGPRRSH